jgi:hypothetical protein
MRNKSPKQIGDLPDELLINILSHVPSGHRMEIRPVSQKWNDIICDIRYHIDPVFICEESGLPYYSSTTPIRFNSVLSTDRKCDKGESQTPWPQSWEVVDEAKGKLGFEVRRRKAGLEYDSDDDDDSSDRD